MEVRRIGPVEVAVLRRDEALARLADAVAAGRPLTVAFCNAHTVNTARARPDFVSALAGALVLNDGIGVDLASRLLYGDPFPDNLNGTDFTPDVLEHAPRPLRLFLLGSAAETVERARDVLAARYPRHTIVGVHHGFFAPEDEAALADRIAAAGTSLLLVGMGHPRQELFAARHAHRVAGPTMCVGAFLDFAAGKVSRAPAWARRLRVEWLYRLALEPRRMANRYLVGNLTFLYAIMRQSRRDRRA